VDIEISPGLTVVSAAAFVIEPDIPPFGIYLAAPFFTIGVIDIV
jgi:hypothetical protein